ncbi:MAG: phenylalanine--tRNA ligase subunit beta [Clostridia bacterium]|nr:phenylalanine--tRNA ligase subunit beta [Clostridia bacterium]
MKVLLSWINDYVDTSSIDLKTLTKGLTDAGFEVEEIIDKSAGLDKVVVANITSITKHPDADKLVVCQADYGFGTTQIVTHADNMKEGDNVPLALDGANLPNGAVIKNGSLRGVASNGMFCSGDELCIDNSIYHGAEVDGLLILEKGLKPGTPIAEVLGMNEVILDVNVLPNRADCNSIYGIAKEIGAIFDLPVKPLALDYKTNSSKKIDVTVEDYELCPRYQSVVVENVKNIASPDWMQKRLTLLGHTPHSLYVDITNYVLVEVGQPMHAFDLSKIKGEQIIVRHARANEKLLTLDEKEHELSENNLVIANAYEPMVIAGIMGGMESGTYETTKHVMLESANFHYANIRRSSHALGMMSDSSIRYSKGVNVENTEVGLKRALNLISTLGAGDISSVIVDNNNGLPETRTVTSRVDKINERLGLNIETQTMVEILNRLGIQTYEACGILTSIIPAERTDIERECDICEEVGRIYGLDKISVEDSTATDFSTVGELTVEQRNINKLKTTSALFGFNETLTWQFGSPKLIQNAGLDLDKHIVIANPIGQDYSVVRSSLIPGMLNTISFNLKQGNKNLKLFELARVFIAKSLPLTSLPDEHSNLCLSLTGNYDFYALKQALNNIMASVGIVLEYRQAQNTMFHPGICADIYLYNRKIGEIGELHPKTRANFEINQKVFIAEINLTNIISRLNDRHTGNAPEKLPYIERDLAIVVDKEIPASKILEVAKKANRQSVVDVKIFDIYMSDAIGENKKSVAFTLYIRQGEKPLTEAEISPIVDSVLQAEINVLDAKLR